MIDKYKLLNVGIVTNNRDPEKLGRVRVRIPGLIDDQSAWALPLGWPGAGGKKRGTFAPPPEGGEVGVMFHLGDVDHPYYWCGNPGRGEAPDEVDDSTPEQAVKVYVLETDRWRITLDSRDGKELCQLRDKRTDDVIEIDGAKMGVRIKGTSIVLIESDAMVKIDAPVIQLGERVVTPNGKPIN